MTTIYEQWQELCKEFEVARKDHFKAFAAVNQAFASVANGGTSNPTNQQLEAMENSWSRLETIKTKMDAFCKTNI